MLDILFNLLYKHFQGAGSEYDGYRVLRFFTLQNSMQNNRCKNKQCVISIHGLFLEMTFQFVNVLIIMYVCVNDKNHAYY
jgi:hypothetical protein